MQNCHDLATSPNFSFFLFCSRAERNSGDGYSAIQDMWSYEAAKRSQPNQPENRFF
jgi:hypothetical protein